MRVALALLLLAIVLVAATPLIVLLDLASGGTGYGLCPEGVEACRSPYTAGPELTVALIVLLFGLVALLRVTLRTMRRAERLQKLASGTRLNAPR